MYIHAAAQSAAGMHDDATFALALDCCREPESGDHRQHLAEISCMLVREGIPHRRIFENDDPYNGDLMAIGCQPMQRNRIGELLRHLPAAR
jgi:hypothetical protein